MQFEDDALIPDPKVWKAFGVTSMTGHRWTHDEKLGFPQPVKINSRNYRPGRELNQFVARKMSEALLQRGQRELTNTSTSDQAA